MPRGNPDSKQADSRYMVPVVRSTFRILIALSTTGPLSQSEVAKRTGVSRSTVFRILTTLRTLGYVIRDTDGIYHLSSRLADLSTDSTEQELLRRTALPQMLRLRQQFGETVNLGHLDVDAVRYLEVVPSEFALRLDESRGARVGLHSSALGKAILAFSQRGFAEALLQGIKLPRLTRHTIVDLDDLMIELRRVRKRGYALDKGETSLLATCIAAPILNESGIAEGAMSISGPTSRFNPKQHSPVVEGLLRAATEISNQIWHVDVIQRRSFNIRSLGLRTE